MATEFIGTSVSSIGPSYSQFSAWLPDNPHVRFFESRQRGYVSVELTAERLTAHLRTVSDVRDPRATPRHRSFVVESDGRAPGPRSRAAARVERAYPKIDWMNAETIQFARRRSR